MCVRYVARLFDGYAPNFEHHLVHGLGYRTPTALFDEVMSALPKELQRPSGPGKSSLPPVWARCGDLGCGSGLAGACFRASVAELHGCDLSPQMVAVTLARPGCRYDSCAAAECVEWVWSQLEPLPLPGPGFSSAKEVEEGSGNETSRGFDLLLSADVFVYFGDLGPMFEAAAAALKRGPSGVRGSNLGSGPGAHEPPRLFAFSVESAPPHVGTFALTGTGRTVHARAYVRGLAKEHGFLVRRETSSVIRQNAGADVVGDIYVLEMPH